MIMADRNDTMAVREFHRAMGLAIDEKPTFDTMVLRLKLFKEEAREYIAELEKAVLECRDTGTVSEETLLRVTAENADVRYILAGDAVALGLPTDLAFNRIHYANMAKVGEDGTVLRNEDGKVLKPEGWKPANLDDLGEFLP